MNEVYFSNIVFAIIFIFLSCNPVDEEIYGRKTPFQNKLLINEQNTLSEKELNCINTAHYLVVNYPVEAIRHLQKCSQSDEKDKLLLMAYVKLKQYEDIVELKSNKDENKKVLLAIYLHDFHNCAARTPKGWDKCVFVFFRELKERWPKNPYPYYIASLYALKDILVVPPGAAKRKNTLKYLSKDISKYKSLSKLEQECAVSSENLKKAYELGATLPVPKSFTTKCGKLK